jgi:hypothetical protein
MLGIQLVAGEFCALLSCWFCSGCSAVFQALRIADLANKLAFLLQGRYVVAFCLGGCGSV